MRPRVIVHNEISIDGRMDPYVGDIGLYYEIAERLGADASLTGCRTILSGLEQFGDIAEDSVEDGADRDTSEGSAGSLLVVIDSQGQVDQWPRLMRQPFWNKIVVLCSKTTPSGYIQSLETLGIEYVIHGESRVDLCRSLDEIGRRFGVRSVRVDSGGTLTGVLLRNGLVDEVSLLIAPYIVGGESPASLFTTTGLTTIDEVTPLVLRSIETLRGGTVWLRYDCAS